MILIALAVVAAAPTVTPLRYGESSYPVPLLEERLEEKETKEHEHLDWLVYLVEADGKRILVDAGFDDPALVKRWGLVNFTAPAQLVQSPGKSVDVVIFTHAHFDHLDGARAFPTAKLVMQRKEWQAFAASSRYPPQRSFWERAQKDGRLVLVDGDVEIAAGVRVLFTGGHTPGSQAVLVATEPRATLIAGDECYTRARCLAGTALPKAAVFDSAKNRAFLAKLPTMDVDVVTLHQLPSSAASAATRDSAAAPSSSP